MNTHILSHLSRSLMILLLMFGLASGEDAPRLQQITHTVLSPASEQISLQLNGSYSPKVFTLKGQSPRVVFDFAGMAQSRGVSNLLTVDGPLLKSVRVGMQSGSTPKTRVVFDLKTLKGVKYTQQFDKTSSTLTIHFTGPEKAATKASAVKQQPPAATMSSKEQTAQKTAPAQTGQPAPASEHVAVAAAASTVTPEAKAKPAAPTEQPPVSAKAPALPIKEKAGQKNAQTAKVMPSAEPVEKEKIEQKSGKMEEVKKTESKTSTTTPTVQEAKPDQAVPKSVASQEPPPEAASESSSEPETVAAPVKSDPELESIKFDPSSPKGEMVMFKLNGFFPPSVHGVEEGIPRVICDFNNTKLTGSTKKLIKTEGKFVRSIRTSKTKKPEKVRVVIDLEPNRSYDLQQVFFKDDNLFVIIVNTVKK
ncbi:MAG: AMIN domain-containing protein [Desulfobulbus sp.]|nr:AMIN domain-containing protein [Desulfobulbus sp.]